MPSPKAPVDQAIFESWTSLINSIYPEEEVRLLRDNYSATSKDYTAIKILDIDAKKSESYSVVVSIEVYGEHAMGRAAKIASVLNQKNGNENLAKNSISDISCTSVRDASRVLDKYTFEERAQFSVEFCFSHN